MPHHGGGGASGVAPPPGGRRGAFEVPNCRRHQAVHFKALNPPRGRARSGPGPSKGRLQPSPCQGHVAEQTPVSCSSKLLGTSKESSATAAFSSTQQALLRDTTEISASSGIDLSGSFHTYPDVGGPFKSLQEAEDAIDSHLQGLQDETMCKESLDKLSPMEWLIQRSLYWPDGKRRKCSEAFASKDTCMDHLLQALVDKYNEDHNLYGDLAYELKDALHYQIMWECERNIWYYHFNFTTKTKGAGGIDNLFFAEVTCMEGDELAASCFCMINTDANGRCYGCTNNGSVGMKHPSEANAYKAGHPDGYLPFGHSGGWDASDDDVEDVKDEEDRLRLIYKGLDDPRVLKEIYTPSPYATATFIED